MLEYQLVRSKRRKTLGLQVKNGHVTVRAPHYITTSFIDTFIQEKSAWLHSKIAEQKEKQQQASTCCDFSQDAALYFLGEQLTLNICIAKQASVFIDNSLIADVELQSAYKTLPRQLNVVISERVQNRLTNALTKAKQVKKQLELYFKAQAEQLIIERLEVISDQIALTPKKITIRQYRARWGSCNNRGEVSFNYLLIMAPIFVIDYVIIHELCHLVYLNHSKDFWQLVESYCPNYKEAKKWLSEYQAELTWNNPS